MAWQGVAWQFGGAVKPPLFSMYQQQYKVKLTGATALLLHQDNLQWSEKIRAWRDDPANRKLCNAGDDRTPAFTWIGCLYLDGGNVVIPSDNLMTMLREGGTKCPTGKRGTFKRQTQSGIIVDQVGWQLITKNGPISSSDIDELIKCNDFKKHEEAVKDLGFCLFVKRSKIGTGKHIRVRPRFDTWSCQGTITVLDETITDRVLGDILTHAGAFAGLGDWRPSSPKSPGPFGKFTVEIKPL